MSKLIFSIWTGASLGIALFLFLLSPVAEISQPRVIYVNSGEGFREIANRLEKEGLIRSQRAFMVFGAFSGSAHKLKPGSYVLNSGSSTPAILQEIVRGPVLDVAVTIPEGATLKDIDAILVRSGVLGAGALVNLSIDELPQYEFLQGSAGLEGFLFPDTYRFFLGSDVKQVVRKFLDNFEKKAWPLLTKDRQPATNDLNLKELIAVASLLEKEVPEYGDRQLVAGILYKRLRVDIGLNVDATISYAKCGGAFMTCEDPKVYRRDLVFPSPYNTYLYKGLPPGPIGNPGLVAIKAALNPLDSDYWYYLSDPTTKNTVFGKTLDEHNENRVRYLDL